MSKGEERSGFLNSFCILQAPDITLQSSIFYLGINVASLTQTSAEGMFYTLQFKYPGRQNLVNSGHQMSFTLFHRAAVF